MSLSFLLLPLLPGRRGGRGLFHPEANVSCLVFFVFCFHFERSPRLRSFIIKLDSNVRWLEVFVPLGGDGGAAAVEVKSYN